MAQASRKKTDKTYIFVVVKQNLKGIAYGCLFFGVLALIIFCLWFSINSTIESPNTQISQLIVTGDRHLSTDDDLRQTVLALGRPKSYLEENVDFIQKQILRLPWIKQVSVRKQWPNTLKIYIEEYHPVAYWNDTQLLDEQGNIFSAPIERLDLGHLVKLEGPEDTQKDVLSQYNTIYNTLLPLNKQLSSPLTITQVSMSERYSWKVQLNHHIELELGRNDIINRLKRFNVIYPVLLVKEGDKIHAVDLRYQTGAAVNFEF